MTIEMCVGGGGYVYVCVCFYTIKWLVCLLKCLEPLQIYMLVWNQWLKSAVYFGVCWTTIAVHMHVGVESKVWSHNNNIMITSLSMVWSPIYTRSWREYSYSCLPFAVCYSSELGCWSWLLTQSIGNKNNRKLVSYYVTFVEMHAWLLQFSISSFCPKCLYTMHWAVGIQCMDSLFIYNEHAHYLYTQQLYVRTEVSIK